MNWRQWAVETAITSMLLGGLCWSTPPDVNESHYLTKAKHFWDGQWCGDDVFLNSFDTHWIAFATFGFPSLIFELATVAWIGRIFCWVSIAASFVRLAKVWTGHNWFGPILAPAVVLFNQFGHWSGEWFCGGAEGKTIAYAFVIFALSYAMENRWRECWVLHGCASAFHILVGGWSMIAFFVASVVLKLPAFCKARSNDDRFSFTCQPRFFPGLLIGVAISLLGLIPALMQNWNTDPEVAVQAAHVQVSSRIAHHLNCFEFQPVRHVAFTFSAIAFAAVCTLQRRNRRFDLIFWAASASLLLAGLGSVLSYSFQFDGDNAVVTRLLALYWFRIADVFIPLAIVMGLLAIGSHTGIVKVKPWVTEILAAIIVLGVIAHSIIRITDVRPLAVVQSQSSYFVDRQHAREAYENWKKLCIWIRENTPQDALFLTPRSQQTFKWYAHRGEVASWKDMPQDADSVQAWIGRFEDIYLQVPEEPYGLLSYLDSELIAMSEKYDIDYLVVWQRHEDQRIQLGDPVSLERVYPADAEKKTTFVLFKFPRPEKRNWIK